MESKHNRNEFEIKAIDKGSSSITSDLLLELSRSLDLDDIFEMFLINLQKHTKIVGLEYLNFKEHISCNYGDITDEKINLELNVEGNNIGYLTIYSNCELCQKETSILKEFIGCLLYPVQNSLKYKTALHDAFIDPLTKVGNRRSLDFSLQNEVEQNKRYRSQFSLAILDLDWFKLYNDLEGHHAGDAVIKATADTIAHEMRDVDKLYRYGGDEFVLILPKTNYVGACQFGDRLQDTINKMLKQFKLPHDKSLGISIGIATCLPTDDPNEIFERADRALYASKNKRK